MGLDGYAFTSKEKRIKAFDEQANQIAYWRRHGSLHCCIERIYKARGGEDPFLGNTIEITVDDMDQLENAVKNGLPPVPGDFWYTTIPAEEFIEQDVAFIAEARRAMDEGLNVFYFGC